MGNARKASRWAATLTALCAVVTTGACGGDGGTDDASPASTTEASEPADTTVAETTTTTLSPEAEVEAAVADYYAMVVLLVQAPDPADPEIAQRATGTNLDRLASNLTQYATLGHVVQRGPNMGQTLIGAEVSGDRATVDVCSVDDSVLIEAATGRVINDDVVTRVITYRLERVDATWLVAETTSGQSWEGVSDCA